MSQYTSSITGNVVYDLRSTNDLYYNFGSNKSYNIDIVTGGSNSGEKLFQLSSNKTKFSNKSIFTKNCLAVVYTKHCSLTNYTISFWCYCSKYPQEPDSSRLCGLGIYGINNSAINLYPFWLYDGTGRQGFQIRLTNNTFYSIETGSILSLNEWHHCAFVGNGDNFIFFVDGNIRQNVTVPNTIPIIFNRLVYIAYRSAEVYFDDITIIDNQVLWSSAFSVPNNYLTGNKTLPKRISNKYKILPDKGYLDYFDKAFLY